MNKNRPYINSLKGWFAVAKSKDIGTGDIKSLQVMNQDLVIFRGKDNKIGVIDAYCSHLGAHLGHGGKVVGDKVQCPFHGLCFNRVGKCEKKPIAGGKDTFNILAFSVQELNGLVFINQEKNPSWELSDFVPKGYCRPILQSFEFKGHPQEIIENTVDLTHFYHIHDYAKAIKNSDIITKDHHLKAFYNLVRKKGLLGTSNSKMEISLDINAKGLGYSQVDISIKKYGLKIRQVVMPTLINNEKIIVRALTTVKEFDFKMPKTFKKILAKIICFFVAREFKRDFIPDIKIWENKKYIENPGIMEKEEDLLLFRQWCKQFYGSGHE